MSTFRPNNLSQREIEVIQLIAEGLTDKEIAARLHVTQRTISEHIVNIRGKLGASNRASAVYTYFFNALAQRSSVASAGSTKMSTPNKTTLRAAERDRKSVV